MRVFDVETASATLIVLHGIDAEASRTSALLHPDALNFLCKVVKTEAGCEAQAGEFSHARGEIAR